MPSISLRPAEPRDVAAITRIYDHAVRHGTASFELAPPDETEMARRQKDLFGGGFPTSWPSRRLLWSATPMRDPIGRGRPIAGPSRI